MTNAEPSRDRGKQPFTELVALRHCLAELELDPGVRQSIHKTLIDNEESVQQRLEQMAWHVERCTLLGQIAVKMVHDIRNPLNAIFLHADVVEEELRQPTHDSQAQIAASMVDIRIEVTHLYDLIQDYLALARLAVVHRELEDLGSFLDECAHDIRTEAESRRVVVYLDGMTRLGRGPIHKATLRRAVLSLLQRALEAMPQGGTLTLRGQRTASSHVTIEVRDTGSSIPEEHLEVLFEPFCATDSESMSLGLYVVREIVAAHHGTIDVQSAPHQGTTFTITLPLVAADARPEH